jgi:predicted O-methyltransferase YrrM
MLIKKGIRIIREEGTYTFFKKTFWYLLNKFQFFLYPYFLFKIKKFNSDNINEFVDFAFNRLSLIKPSQIREEIFQLLLILEERKPKVILEIGTAKGGTLFLFSRIAFDEAKIISIDLPQGRFGGYPKWEIPLYKSFARENQKIYLIRADSHNQETLKKVKNILNGEKIDFLFIDGDHSYQGVKRDFDEMYSGLVKQGGIIAFHDIVCGPYDNVGGVPEFWKEIKERNEHQEIVKDWSQNGYGIGIVYKSQ